MTRLPDESISFQNTVGDSGVENLYVYGELNYDFKNDDITVNKINVTSTAVVGGDVTFSGSVDLNASLDVNDNLVVQKDSTLGNSTDDSVIVNGHLYVNRTLRDADGDTGSSGQLLSSTGSGTNWIDPNTTSVANSINVGTNLDSTDADQFVTFVRASSGNNPIRVDAGIKYNPSTNRLTAGSFAGDGANLTNLTVDGFVSGMIIAWSGSVANIPSGFVLCDGNNNTPDLRDRFIIGAGNSYAVDATGGSKDATLPTHFHHAFKLGNSSESRFNSTLTASNYAASGTGAGNLNEAYNIVSKSSEADVGKTSDEGSSATNANLPPYHALCYIMKT